MNNRLFRVLILFSILITFIGGLSVLRLFGQKNASNIDAKNSLKDTVESYWNFSIKGDYRAVAQVSTIPPKDFLERCTVSKNPSGMEGETQAENRYLVENPAAHSKLDYFQDKEQRNIFENDYVPSTVSNMSNYIYASKVSLKRINIQNEIVYQDEAIVNLTESNYEGNSDSATNIIMFLKRKNNDWRIIGIVDRDTMPEMWRTINYATPRPPCS